MAEFLERLSVSALFERMFELEREGLNVEAQVVRSFIEAKIKGNNAYILMYTYQKYFSQSHLQDEEKQQGKKAGTS